MADFLNSKMSPQLPHKAKCGLSFGFIDEEDPLKILSHPALLFPC